LGDVYCADHDQAKGRVERLVENLWARIRVGREANIDSQSTFDIGAVGLGIPVTSVEQLLLARLEVGRNDDGLLAFDVGEDGL
jgi:hypothetical protein